MLRFSGWDVQSFSWILASDLGTPVARPLVVAGRGQRISVDVDREYEKVLARLGAGVEPLWRPKS
jgi:hypothetical protein